MTELKWHGDRISVTSSGYFRNLLDLSTWDSFSGKKHIDNLALPNEDAGPELAIYTFVVTTRSLKWISLGSFI